jgi:hypothetical protein
MVVLISVVSANERTSYDFTIAGAGRHFVENLLANDADLPRRIDANPRPVSRHR